MRLMRMLGVALVWVLGVALVASVSWVAINSAGRQVVDTTAVNIVKADGDVAGTLPPTSPSTPSTPPTPPTPPTPSTSPTMSTAATSTTTGTPGSALDVPVSANQPGSGRPTIQSQNPPQAPPSAPSAGPLSDTLVTAGGAVWLECTGSLISNSLVQPHDGWSAERYQRPGDVQAHFDRRDVRIDVQATCVAGQPRFLMRTEKRDHDEYRDD